MRCEKKHGCLLHSFLLHSVLNAQKSGDRDWEIGVNSGISWYNGDLNPTKFFGSDYYHQAIGVSLRKNLNRRFALRGQFIYGRLSANDQASKSSFQLNRNLNFSTPIYELSSTIEFNFLEYDPLIRKYQFSPYSFIGLSIFRFNPETEIEGSVYELQPLATEGKSYSLVFSKHSVWIRIQVGNFRPPII